MLRRNLLLISLVFMPQPSAATDFDAGVYRLDPSHTTVLFSVNHLGLSNYVGGFDEVDATLTIDPEAPDDASLVAEVNVGSLDLPAPPPGFLDEMLGETWFNASAHPVMTFTSDAITLTDESTAQVSGTLSMLGNEGPVTLIVTFNTSYPAGMFEPHARLGFSATAEISRTAFGMGFGTPAEGSTLGVGDDVTIRIEAEFTGPD